MKELSIKQKAEAYDKALEKICRFIDGYSRREISKEELEDIFPELQESEDEKIKKTLIDYFITYKKQEECGINTFFGIPTDNVIAWLEKQGGHDSIEEPNFFNDFRNSDVEVDSNEDGLIAATIKYKNEHNFTWREEDDNCLSTIIAEFSKCAGKSVSKDEWMRCNDFLNSLRDRVQSSPKQEWSEDDEEMIEGLNNCLDELEKERNWIYVYVNNKNVKLNKVRNWLKSIKPQSQWETK